MKDSIGLFLAIVNSIQVPVDELDDLLDLAAWYASCRLSPLGKLVSPFIAKVNSYLSKILFVEKSKISILHIQREFFRFPLIFTQTGRQPKLPVLCLRFWLSSRLGKKEEKSKRLTLQKDKFCFG
jgi:hypothetical protein